MTEPGFIKCPCRHCGGRIEFPTQAIGMTVDCPHCGQKTLLGRAAAATKPAAAPAAPAAEPVSASATSARRPYVVLGVLCALLAVAGGIWWWRQREPSAPPPPPQPASFKGKMAAMESAEGTASSAAPAPAPGKARPKSLDDLKAGAVTLEKARSGSLVYAVGTLRNESDQPRYGVRVEIALTDANGQPLRVATDYAQTIEPRAEWRFRALVLDAKATAGKIASIKEEP